MDNTAAGDWWKEAIIYEVWPKSFYSGKGTSCGDIPGLISKLGYIKSLGINTIWLAPHYTSVRNSSLKKRVQSATYIFLISPLATHR
jgi:glycosidase